MPGRTALPIAREESTLRAPPLWFAWMAKAPETSALIDTHVIYCGGNLENLREQPEDRAVSNEISLHRIGLSASRSCISVPAI